MPTYAFKVKALFYDIPSVARNWLKILKYSFSSFITLSLSPNFPATCLNRVEFVSPFVYQSKCFRKFLLANFSPKNSDYISQCLLIIFSFSSRQGTYSSVLPEHNLIML